MWRVQFVRDLGATNRNDVPLGVGEKVSVAFAIWDGSVADRNGQKTVSIWNTLRLEH
jgi:DMSO reductase family type II enzyme heme b subunit